MVFKIVLLFATCVLAAKAETHSVSTSSTNVNGVGHSVTNTDGVVRGTYSEPDPYTGGQRVIHYDDVVSDNWNPVNPWHPVYPNTYPNPIQQIRSIFPRFPIIPSQISQPFSLFTPNYSELDQEFITSPFGGNNFPRTPRLRWQNPQYPIWY